MIQAPHIRQAGKESTRVLGTLVLAILIGIAAGSAPAVSVAGVLRPKLILWGYSPGVTFTQPSGIAFDPSDGAIYVANTGEHRIEVFSKKGRPLCCFVHRVAGPGGRLVDGDPVALAFDHSGRLLVVDHRARYVDVVSRRGRPETRLSVAAGQPNAIAVGPDGAIYVGTAAEESKIYSFRPDYTPDSSWGEQGTVPGSLFNVSALAVMPDSTIAVACTRTDLVVQIFTPTGHYLRGFGQHELGDGNFSLPSGMVATADGRVWVIDEIRQTLQVFDQEGSLVAVRGGRGAAPGEFAHPSSLTSDGMGLIALTDRELGRVQVFGVFDE